MHPRSLATRRNPSPLAQQSEVAGDTRLKFLKRGDEFTDADLPFNCQQRQDTAPRRIADQIDIQAHVHNITTTLYMQEQIVLIRINIVVNLASWATMVAP